MRPIHARLGGICGSAQALYIEDPGAGDDGTAVAAGIEFAYDIRGNRVKKTASSNTSNVYCFKIQAREA